MRMDQNSLPLTRLLQQLRAVALKSATTSDGANADGGNNGEEHQQDPVMTEVMWQQSVEIAMMKVQQK